MKNNEEHTAVFLSKGDAMNKVKGPLHVDRLNTFEKLEAEGFTGTDVSLEISLREYGIAWRESKTEPGTFYFIYGIKLSGEDHVRFDRAELKAADFQSDFDWVDWEEYLTSKVDYGNDSKEEAHVYEGTPYALKVLDLYNYYGFENVFGSSYWIGFGILDDTRLDGITDAYIRTALWASLHFVSDDDNDGTPMDSLYDKTDLGDGVRDAMKAEIRDYLELCDKESVDTTGLDAEVIGHNFWLTRNGHGTGFWDLGLGELGDKLTDWAKSMGGANLYVGDDGKVNAH